MDKNKFIYRYSVPTEDERREIEEIRKQYGNAPQEKDKLTQLRELDTRVRRSPVAWGIVLGILGILIFGTGLTMVLEWMLYIGGIAVMIVGCVPMTIAYPLHNAILRHNKEKYGDRILRLSDELLHEEEGGKQDA